MSTPYKYRVDYPKTADWYDPGGRWYQLSTWCMECIAPGDWEYYFGEFVFIHEHDYMLFKLKWL